MQYKWWITAFYDEYCERKKELEKNRHERFTLKKFLKALLEKENRLLLIFMICVLIISILFIVGIIDPVGYVILLFSSEILMLLPESYRNSKKIRLSYYKENINILIDILVEEGLYDTEIINRLLEDTGGIFYKIKSGSMNYVKSIILVITSIPIALGIKGELNLEFKTIIVITIVVIFILSVIVWVYFLIKSLSFTDSYKKEQLHERLKIILMYKLADDNKKNKQRRHPSNIKKG